MSTRKVTMLVVDDDVRILRMVQRVLELEGYRVLKATSGKDALEVFSEETPDLVLLDIMMPDIDGYTACKQIREFSQVPIIMLTAKSTDEEKVGGFDAGADDYMTKPFSSKELAARVKAVLRRTTLWEERPEPVFRYRNLLVDFARQRVTLGEQEVDLTGTGYRLLSLLARNAGRIMTPDQILEKVWGEEYRGENHLLQVNIARLRQKLRDNAGKSSYIMTRPGIGYMIERKDLTRQ